MKRIVLNEEELTMITDFCETMKTKQLKSGSRDNIRKDNNTERRFMNNVVGKIGEYSATKITGGKVDFSIWETGSRGKDQFEPDIFETEDCQLNEPFQNKNIHVKTCAGSHQYLVKNLKGEIEPTLDASWTIDKKDPVYNDPLDNDILVLMFSYLNGEAKSYYLGYVYATDIKDMWKNCRASFIQHKKALYWKDLENSGLLHK